MCAHVLALTHEAKVMKNSDEVFNKLCELIDAIDMPDRISNKNFLKNWSEEYRKLTIRIQELSPDEYIYVENKYKQWIENRKDKK